MQFSLSFLRCVFSGIPVIPLFVSPSISPYHFKGFGSINPSLRLYQWNDTNVGSKYYQYHTHLLERNKTGGSPPLNWSLEYISTSLISGLSAPHLHHLSNDFVKANTVYIDKFFEYHLSGQPHDDKRCIHLKSCRCRIVCGIQNIDYDMLDNCLEGCYEVKGHAWLVIIMIIALVILSLIGLATLSIINYGSKRHHVDFEARAKQGNMYYAK